MNKDKVFILRMTEQDMRELANISKMIKRSKSGVLRFALHEIARVIREHPDKTKLIHTIRVD